MQLPCEQHRWNTQYRWKKQMIITGDSHTFRTQAASNSVSTNPSEHDPHNLRPLKVNVHASQ